MNDEAKDLMDRAARQAWQAMTPAKTTILQNALCQALDILKHRAGEGSLSSTCGEVLDILQGAYDVMHPTTHKSHRCMCCGCTNFFDDYTYDGPDRVPGERCGRCGVIRDKA